MPDNEQDSNGVWTGAVDPYGSPITETGEYATESGVPGIEVVPPSEKDKEEQETPTVATPLVPPAYTRTIPNEKEYSETVRTAKLLREAEAQSLPAGVGPKTIDWWLSAQAMSRVKGEPIEQYYTDSFGYAPPEELISAMEELAPYVPSAKETAKPTDTVIVKGEMVAPTEEQQLAYYKATGQLAPTQIFVPDEEGEEYVIPAGQVEGIKESAKFWENIPAVAATIEEWVSQQIDRGLAKDEKEARQQLAEIQSGVYQAWMPDEDNPEDISKGGNVPVWHAYVLQREALGLTPRELGEIYSGRYIVDGIPTTKSAVMQRESFEKELASDFPQLYSIYKEQGVEAYNMEASKLDKEHQEFLGKLASGDIIQLPDNQYITKSSLDKQPQGVQEILRKSGFSGLEGIQETKWVYQGREISQGDRERIIKDYEESKTDFTKQGKMYTDEWYALGGNPANQMKLSRESAGRLGVKGLSFVTPPAKALLAEYKVGDVTPVEWALGAVNVALLASSFVPGAIIGSIIGRTATIGVSTAGAGLVGYEVKTSWGDVSTAQKVMGVGGALLYAVPILATVGRGIRVSSVKAIPTATGEVVPWRGLSVFQNPIIGKSGGKWVVGARSITLPEARMILDGYHPDMMLETKVFVNPKSLTKAGLSAEQIDYLVLTLKDRNLFAGEKSPYLSKEALIEPTERLDADEISVLLKQINKQGEKIKQVDMVYGSATMKAQLAPELRGWRGVHDWDISTKLSQEKTVTFAEEMLSELVKTGRGREYSIDPKNPTHILKKVDGKWEGIADIHSHEEPAGTVSEIPASKLDSTGEYSYGRMVAEPAITVRYPGLGKLDIMRLSESGVRKSDTLLRVRKTETGTAFRPPERGIATLRTEVGAPKPGIGSPGVPKDAADFYVVLRTFKGKDIADEWAKSWAKAMGYTDDEIAGLLPNILKSMDDLARQTPSDMIGWRFKPSFSKVTYGTSPSITISVPRSLSASVSSSLLQRISAPVSPYTRLAGIPSAAIPSVSQIRDYSTAVSRAISASGVVSLAPSVLVSLPTPTSVSTGVPKSVSPSVPTTVSRSISSTVGVTSKPLSPSPSLAVPSVPPYPSTPPYPTKSPYPVGYAPPFGSISPSPTSPSVPPYPSAPPTQITPTLVPHPRPPVFIRPRGDTGGKRISIPPGAIAFKQGLFWKYIPPPYKQSKPITLLRGIMPIGAKWSGSNSPYDTIQIIGKAGAKVPNRVDIDLGFVDIAVIRGKEIQFRRGGESTDVGTRMPEMTKGMELDGGEVVAERQKQRVVRVARTVRKLRRKARRSDDFSDLTSLRGIKW